jgi:putative FmdB family regulatory protein
MPLFEYDCSGCGHRFEELVRGAERPACPRCDGSDLQKLPSVFAVSGPAAGGRAGRGAGAGDDGWPAGGGACGTCGDPRGPGACATTDPRAPARTSPHLPGRLLGAHGQAA